MEEHLTNQLKDGGLIPTTPLQNSVKAYQVNNITREEAAPFVEKWHYSHSCPSGKFFFGLFFNEVLLGVAVFGHPTGRQQANAYWGSAPNKLIELRRLCCIDATPKNTESRFISICLRALAHTDYEAVLAMADINIGHQGIIYQASNFKRIKVNSHPRYRVFLDGKEIHDRKFAKQRHELNMTNKEVLLHLFGDRVEFKKGKCKLAYLYILRKIKGGTNESKRQA
uniref:Uncharacterized protein n=1 Tax=viral metagenome TaxID=1070528 RepID=A0A6M3L638_9ZZZZ